MNYWDLFNNTFQDLGFDLVPEWNSFEPPYDPERGWTLKLPEFKPGSNTLILVHFQDFVTNLDGTILELDKVEKFYGDRCSQVLVTHWTYDLQKYYHGPLNLIEYSQANVALGQRLVSRQAEWQPLVNGFKTKAWQSLNGRTCDHRRRVANILYTWSNGILSYGNKIPLAQWAYDTYRGTENDDNFVRLASVYGSAAVNIVTETEYCTPPGIVTEKTLFAMAAKQIPIVIGYAGIVADCRRLGFDMFDDVVDNSFDLLPNDVRVEQALCLNQDLIQGRIDLSHLQQRLERNQHRMLYEFPEQIINNFVQQAQQLRTTITADFQSTFPNCRTD